MKVSVSSAAMLGMLVTTTSWGVSRAFAPSRPHTTRTTTPTRLFETDEKVAALRAAAAKAREEAQQLERELGKTSPESLTATTKTTTTTVATSMSPEQIRSLVPSLLSEADASKRLEGWRQLQQQSKQFGSANLKTFPVSMQMLEQRTSLTAASLGLDDRNVDLDDFKYATLYVAGGSAVLGVLALAVLPPNIGATLCYLIALVPVLFLGIGSTAPGLIADAIARIKGQGPANRANQRERVCRHEAAHLCCGYWCGLPITEYNIEDQNPSVAFGVTSAGTQPYSATEVAALAVIGLAGSVAEALKWEQASGAAQDLIQIENVFRRAKEFYGANAQQDVTRWAAFTAALLLRQNSDTYERVVQALERQAPLEECIAILES